MHMCLRVLCVFVNTRAPAREHVVHLIVHMRVCACWSVFVCLHPSVAASMMVWFQRALHVLPFASPPCVLSLFLHLITRGHVGLP